MTDGHDLPTNRFAGVQLRFLAWLDLPFPVIVRAERIVECEYRPGTRVDLRITVRSDMLKLVTGSWAKERIQVSRWLKERQDTKELPRDWIMEYVSEDRAAEVHDRIQKLGEAEYVHFEEVPSVAQIECLLPAGISGKASDFMQMLPDGGFFEKQIIPQLQQIIDVYRIAAFPWMRYGIPPISVETVRRAVVEIHDNSDSRIGRIHYLLASTSIINRFGAGYEPVQARFDRIGKLLESHESENQFASAYHLCRIQRWTEALSIASAVVDHLISRLIHRLIPVKAVAGSVLNPLRIENIFNKVLPELGLEKLAETQNDLWTSFISARRERGALAHGGFSNRNRLDQDKSIKHDLGTFYGMCKWLSTQLGEQWLLDVPEVTERLEPF